MKNKLTRITLLFLRLSLGWLMFYAGISKLTQDGWSAAGFLAQANTLPQFYYWLASPGILPITNFLSEWGPTFLGLSLIFGLFVRLSSALGMLMMFLYYLPGLDYPFIPPNGYLVDKHIIFIFVLLLFISTSAGRIYGLDGLWTKSHFAKKHPKLVKFLA